MKHCWLTYLKNADGIIDKDQESTGLEQQHHRHRDQEGAPGASKLDYAHSLASPVQMFQMVMNHFVKSAFHQLDISLT
jgi:hypothetical protein